MRFEKDHGHMLQVQALLVMLLVTSVCTIICFNFLEITTIMIMWVFISLYGAEKVVGTATAMKDQQENKVVWRLSTGDILTVCLGDELSFQLKNEKLEEEV